MLFSRDDGNVLVALEIGTSKVVAAVAEARLDGTMTLLGVGEVAASGIRKGEIVEFADAQKCIQQALTQAERQTDAEISEVYLALTGPHILSRTDSVRTVILEEDRLVTPSHVDELTQIAHNLVIPRDYVMIHSLLQHYYLDNQTLSREPVGVISGSLEGKYHLVYGLKTRLQTAVRCVRELDVDINGYALASYAMSQAILSEEDKQAGAVAIDCGAGVTNYIVYLHGAVAHSGVLGIGADHMTQDLAMGLRLPYLKAEQLKKEHGDLFMDGRHPDEKVILSRDMSFEERSIYRDSIVKILHARQREVLNLIEQDIAETCGWSQITGGVFITGGASQLNGLQKLADEIFPVPVHMAHEHNFEGDQTYSRRPDLSTVIGLLQYAQQREAQRARTRGWRGWRQSVSSLLAAMKLF